MKLKTLFGAALVALLPIASSASTMTGGISVSGDVVSYDDSNLANLSIDFVSPATLLSADGDLATVAGSGGCFDCVTMNDIISGGIGTVWTVGNLSFASTSFANLTTASNGFVVDVFGVLSDSTLTFDDTDVKLVFSVSDADARLNFSAVGTAVSDVPIPGSALLLLGGLGGIAALRRRKRV